MRLLFMGLVVLGNVADYLSTRYALKRGAMEMNPLVRDLGLGITKLLAVLIEVGVLWFFPSQEMKVVSLLIVIVLAVVALNNVQVARALSKEDAGTAH